MVSVYMFMLLLLWGGGQCISLVGQDLKSTIIVLWPEAASIHQRNIKTQAQREAEERNGYNQLVPTPNSLVLMEKSVKWLSVDPVFEREVLDGSYS